MMGSSVSGVGVLDKAISVLAAVEAGPCSLTELTGRTGLPRATAHRLALALQRHHMVGRDGQGRFVLGERLAELGRAADARPHRSLAELAQPALAALRDATGESVQLYVQAADTRVCVAALESPHGLRTIVAIGAVLPMDRGSAAKVLSDDGAARQGWAQSVEERERGVASVSAPVRSDGIVVAAVSVSGPLERTTRQPGRRYSAQVMEAAARIEAALRSDRAG